MVQRESPIKSCGISFFIKKSSFYIYLILWKWNEILHINQERSHNLKEVAQKFTEVSYTADVIADDVIQRNQHRKGKKPCIP